MKNESQHGFSLVEVIVALGLLAAVLISVSGLFVLGERQVKSGRTHSSALAVARDIIEELNGWSFDGLYENFGFAGGANPSYLVDTRFNSYAAQWQLALDAELNGAYAQVRLESIDPGGTPPALNAADAVRVRVVVHWSEGPRARSLELATVRM